MSDDYLWDRSGPPDPEIERLERVLAPLRGSVRPRRFEAVAPMPDGAVARSARRAGRRWALVSGLVLAGGAAGALALRLRSGRNPAAGSSAPAPARLVPGGWDLRAVTGRPSIEGRPLGASGRLEVGETLVTDAGSRARLEVPDVGTVQIDPRTRVQLLGTGSRGHRLKLSRGVLHGTIFAPPGTFFIETPAGVAVDLGCIYTVEVGPEGDGLVSVQSGWVGFQRGGRESFIPEGAACAIRVRTGPGTPCFADAPEGLRSALADFDTTGVEGEQVRALRAVLARARPRDALTLWHLLERVPAEARSRVLRRLHALVPATVAVPASRVLAGERKAIDELWDRMGLGPIALWRHWKADLDRDPGR